jgi:guanine deaminase
VVINPACTPWLARKTQQAASLDELLFAMIVLGDDRLIERVVIAQPSTVQSDTTPGAPLS